MYSVWFRDLKYGLLCCFMGNVPDRALAERIAHELVCEEFVSESWVEKD